jgi:hypothetical protein
MANRIAAFIHCRRCLEEMPRGTSPREWVRLECGWTPEGLQVWCVRHELNVLDTHFRGQKIEQLPTDYDPDKSH